MATPIEFFSGTCAQLLFSPQGAIEGVLVKVKGRVIQVSLDSESGEVFARTVAPAKRLRVLVTEDHSPKTRDAAHPVYKFQSFADASGRAIESTDSSHSTITGIVAKLHYARHGQPNGVLLEGGEFIHLRPHGMAQVGLEIGAKVRAVGEIRMTVLGTRMLEAREVNRMVLA